MAKPSIKVARTVVTDIKIDSQRLIAAAVDQAADNRTLASHNLNVAYEDLPEPVVDALETIRDYVGQWAAKA